MLQQRLMREAQHLEDLPEMTSWFSSARIVADRSAYLTTEGFGRAAAERDRALVLGLVDLLPAAERDRDRVVGLVDSLASADTELPWRLATAESRVSGSTVDFMPRDTSLSSTCTSVDLGRLVEGLERSCWTSLSHRWI